ncbi:MAG TPA: CDP-alcohol phosphatidyltransferase family protein [Polyangia bacterium]
MPRDRSFRLAICLGFAAVGVASVVVEGGAPRPALAFALPASGAWLIAAATLWWARALAPAAAPLALPTWVTLGRALLSCLVAGFTLLPPSGPVRWVPALLYAAAALADRADGGLARRRGAVTALGTHLDGAMDALGLLAAPLCAVAWGRLPPWYLALGAAYYVYQGAISARRWLGLPVFLERVTRRPLTRIFAGLQMTLVAAALAPVLPAAFVTPLATILMLPTLAFFARDWLIVIGRLPGGAGAAAAAPLTAATARR